MISYKTTGTDTLESISRKLYGVENYAENILKANPGLSAELTAGLDIVVPYIPGVKDVISVTTLTDAANLDEVAVLIDGVRFKFWSELRITRAIDVVDTVEFSSPFEADFREIFKPFSFKELQVTVGGELLFTGTMIGVTPFVGEGGKTVTVSGYAKPGVLNDCTASAGDYPLQYDKQNLEDITKAIILPFGLGAVFNDDVGAVFTRVAAKTGQTILSFLAELAKQRNLIISSTPLGELLMQKSVTDGPVVAQLVQGASPVLSIETAFSPQEYYSHITGIEPVVVGQKGSQFTVKNPRLTGVLRPFTFTANDTEAGTVKAAVEAKAGRMFGNMVSYRVKVDTWRDALGALWLPGATVTLFAEDAMVYAPYRLIVRSVDFERRAKTKTAMLDLVIPESFKGEIPERLPWE